MPKVLHTCTDCVPIDSAIIDAYVALVETNKRATAAAEQAEAAADHTPYIGDNGHWWEWDNESEQFVDTLVPASGAVTVDDHLDASSINPVQNKVTTEALSELNDLAGNREYDVSDPDGLGYVILAKDQTFASQVTSVNTIYEVRYDYALDGATVTVPEGCVLKMNGGKISGGTISGNNTVIDAPNGQIFDNVTFSGTFSGALNATWVGAKADDTGFDNSPILQAWLNSYCLRFRKISFPTGTYTFTHQSQLTSDNRDLVLEGNNSYFRCNIADNDDTGAYFLVLSNTNSTTASSGENFRIENVRIKNVRQTSGKDIAKTRCILFDRAQRFEVHNVQIWYFDVAVELIDIWYGGFTGQNIFRLNRIGILCKGNTYYEVNTVEAQNVDFKGVTRATVAALYPQNDGESDADYVTRTASCGVDAYCHLQGVAFRGCIFESFDYGIRTNWTKRSSAANTSGGTLTIDGDYFEDNRVYDIYVGNGNVANTGTGSSQHIYIHKLSISNCRFFGLNKVYLYGAAANIQGNQDFDLDAYTSSSASTIVEYSGTVNIKSVGGSALLHKVGTRTMSITDASGNFTIPATNFQRVNMLRYVSFLSSRLNGYTTSGTANYDTPVSFAPWAFRSDPDARMSVDIHPLSFYLENANSYQRLLVPSGDSLTPVRCDNSYNFRSLNKRGSISLYEFIRRWKAGTSYTGTVANLFSYTITADPTAGTVTNESGTIVGFGINALGTTITTSYTTSYLMFIDALVAVRISFSKIKQYCDLLQCGRTYSELRNGINESSTYSAYLSCYGTNANMASVQKRLNAVYYDTTNSKLMIFNGYEWVEMTSPFLRFYYKSSGSKLSERTVMADLPGQTFHNNATGITYTFSFMPRNTYQWVPGIGKVSSLEHPNGYSLDDTLDYANELSAGEQVVCNGRLYTWDGTQFCTPNSGATTSRPSLVAVDAGYQFFDTTLGKCIVWNGTAWVNVDGTALS